MDIGRITQHALSTGLEEVMEFLEQSFPNLEIAIAHGKVIFLHIFYYVNMLQLRALMLTLLLPKGSVSYKLFEPPCLGVAIFVLLFPRGISGFIT